MSPHFIHEGFSPGPGTSLPRVTQLGKSRGQCSQSSIQTVTTCPVTESWVTWALPHIPAPRGPRWEMPLPSQHRACVLQTGLSEMEARGCHVSAGGSRGALLCTSVFPSVKWGQWPHTRGRGSCVRPRCGPVSRVPVLYVSFSSHAPTRPQFPQDQHLLSRLCVIIVLTTAVLLFKSSPPQCPRRTYSSACSFVHSCVRQMMTYCVLRPGIRRFPSHRVQSGKARPAWCWGHSGGRGPSEPPGPWTVGHATLKGSPRWSGALGGALCWPLGAPGM